MPTVDVRDVAKAHLEGVLRDEANNKRFVLCAEDVWMTEIGQMLHKKYSQHYRRITHTQINKCLLWMVAFCDAQAAAIYRLWGLVAKMDNSETRDILGITFTPVQ